ncbi:ergothioneine biosynthesis protein EgtB [Mucilaginibacter phyllosphaerae]|uniref:Ergothioneine biosynthesis protein EgtB n=1 Tax=Mucilaginibacter phyllosphaerae TaxID=1812349 RepID=A0A4Y8ADU9_9SPHI|nr:ergothioneine biosynthesis protein EgtB [Mucilaginibacter phyllosphaerae]MBB3970404.1 ergothioneine biosynthesis protein EgtB [Mucilaginibacter phyllosphaerae]TEW66770.1 ergothioneine biosynthesis protein EgtB [Mucilaginibacter phyllosphaerae]GGH11817.1 ergothioneine biosynthesis protein EgtB [Mucilaginibacter phyllosphaerae]
MDLADCYKKVRQRTDAICEPLQTEDYVVQPVVDVSPPKWHIGHTTWFFETFILKPYFAEYQEFDPNYNYVFNSYYETVGNRVIRTDRGNLSRPTVIDVKRYRKYVDDAMYNFLACGNISPDVEELLVLGFNHEEQHQELLLTDIKYILGNNPLFPAYDHHYVSPKAQHSDGGFIRINEGIYEVGFKGEGFAFDNELNRHKVYLNEFEISPNLVTNAEYLEFINAGGYHDFRHWHAAGWDWVNTNQVQAPMYWHNMDGQWHNYTYQGLQTLHLHDVVTHISYYEAYAYASWKGLRLPTEFEWEVAAPQFSWGLRWEWTESAYLPYPGFAKAPGAIGEYNGKFMVGQKVLRGASEVTSPDHSRITYRNFFQPELRWQFTGIRLAK